LCCLLTDVKLHIDAGNKRFFIVRMGFGGAASMAEKLRASPLGEGLQVAFRADESTEAEAEDPEAETADLPSPAEAVAEVSLRGVSKRVLLEVANFPETWGQKRVFEQYFEQFGKVNLVRLGTRPKDNEDRAQIGFAIESDMQKALKATNGAEVEGRTLRCVLRNAVLRPVYRPRDGEVPWTPRLRATSSSEARPAVKVEPEAVDGAETAEEPASEAHNEAAHQGRDPLLDAFLAEAHNDAAHQSRDRLLDEFQAEATASVAAVSAPDKSRSRELPPWQSQRSRSRELPPWQSQRLRSSRGRSWSWEEGEWEGEREGKCEGGYDAGPRGRGFREVFVDGSNQAWDWGGGRPKKAKLSSRPAGEQLSKEAKAEHIASQVRLLKQMYKPGGYGSEGSFAGPGSSATEDRPDRSMQKTFVLRPAERHDAAGGSSSWRCKEEDNRSASSEDDRSTRDRRTKQKKGESPGRRCSVDAKAKSWERRGKSDAVGTRRHESHAKALPGSARSRSHRGARRRRGGRKRHGRGRSQSSRSSRSRGQGNGGNGSRGKDHRSGHRGEGHIEAKQEEVKGEESEESPADPPPGNFDSPDEDRDITALGDLGAREQDLHWRLEDLLNFKKSQSQQPNYVKDLLGLVNPEGAKRGHR